MKKIRIRDKDYNCSNMLYYHIQALESENRLFNMEIKAHEQNELELQDRLSKAIKYIEDNVAVYAFNNKRIPHWEMNDDEIKELLDILKGSDKE